MLLGRIETDDVVDGRHVHTRVLVDGPVSVARQLQRVLAVAIAEQLLATPVKTHLIKIGIVRVAALLTVTDEDNLALQGVDLLYTPGH